MFFQSLTHRFNSVPLLIVLAILAQARLCPAQQSRPNIITVFIDDMGWSDLSCFGGTAVKTEHIDQLAAEGLRFTNFYVNSPICSPSRVALTTGQYPHRWRITSYLARRQLNDERGVAQWLDPSAPILARELKKSGYATGHFGKWHMGGQRDVGEAPLITEYGFEQSLTNFEGLGPRVLPLKDAYDGRPPQRHDLGSANLGRGEIRWEDRSVITAAFVDDALRFIDDAQKNDKPFFVNLWPDDVHSPFFPPELLRNKTDGSKRALYYAVLEAMDEQLARLFDRIRNDQSLRENTLILVASDNGHEEGAGQSAPLRGAKTWLYEGGVRSPLIVWGPGLLAKSATGTTNDMSILCALDVNRSLYSLTGTSLPDGVVLDGEDLADTLLGKSQSSRKSPIFWRRPPDRPGSKTEDNPDLSVREGKWKYYINYDGSNPQLYDLSQDISEKNNLIVQHQTVGDRLKQAILAWNENLPTDAGDPAHQSVQAAATSIPSGLFVNPIGEGADPWVVRDNKDNRYLWCMSQGNRAIAIHTTDQLTSMGARHIVWTAPETGPYSQEVWAPELHLLDGHWHIYFAASNGKNENHLTYVLRSKSDDPLGDYDLHGPLATGEGADGMSPNIWAIDMTVLEHDGNRYAIWSGWDAPGTDRQYLYIAPMETGTRLAAGRVRICSNDDFPWEFTEERGKGRGLNEGPQVLKLRNRTFVTYSCAASWLPTYKLGLLELTGDNPLEPSNWTKQKRPVFRSSDETYGVGHSCFVKSPDDTEWWHVFHAKRDRNPGWRRAVFVQPMDVNRDGFPSLGSPVPAGQLLRIPSGQNHETKHSGSIQNPLKSNNALSGWTYFGHHQHVDFRADGLHLGITPDHVVNGYRCGEKLLLDDVQFNNMKAAVTIDFRGNATARDAGILFRTTGASVGYDAQRGYFAGLIPSTGLMILGKTDGQRWSEIARVPIQIDVNQRQRLQISAEGPSINVSLNGTQTLSATDATFPFGTTGLRVVNSHAVFSDFEVSAP